MNCTTERARLAEAGTVAEHLALALDRAGRAMTRLLDGDEGPVIPGIHRNAWPDAQSEPEQAAEWAATALDNAASRLLELHRTGDGPGPRRFAHAARAYAKALRVAAAGRWPPDLDAIAAELHYAIAETRADTSVVVESGLAGHRRHLRGLREAGLGALAEELEFETRHLTTALEAAVGTQKKIDIQLF